MSEMKTRHIVIAASARKAGKTLLAQSLLGLAVEEGLVCAFVKLRRRVSSVLSVTEGEGSDGTDTARCAAAGASRCFLVEYWTVDQLREFSPSPPLDSSYDMVLWETNSAVGFVGPDSLVYLEVEQGAGKNPELAAGATFVVPAPLSGPPDGELCSMILHCSGLSGFRMLKRAFKCWLGTSRGTVLGHGIARLLRFIGQTGSISSGSKQSGISYRRAWTLLERAEANMGARLVSRTRGGSRNGGSSLTLLAERLLTEYDELEKALSSDVRVLEDL
ncbi:MAG: LysR family transcriptional regulator [Candidatus Fermentibacteraceae bacterium]